MRPSSLTPSVTFRRFVSTSLLQFFEQVDDIVQDVKAAYPGVRLGIHCHNDQGLAVANSLQAVRSGVDVVQVRSKDWRFMARNIDCSRRFSRPKLLGEFGDA